MTHKDLREGDILAVEIASVEPWGNTVRFACFQVVKVSRSWLRWRRPYLLIRAVRTGYRPITRFIFIGDLTGTKMWCSGKQIDETLQLPSAFVRRGRKTLEASK